MPYTVTVIESPELFGHTGFELALTDVAKQLPALRISIPLPKDNDTPQRRQQVIDAIVQALTVAGTPAKRRERVQAQIDELAATRAQIKASEDALKAKLDAGDF